jgi:hypothetical protein
MDLKLYKIVLWPKNPSNQRREITFKCSGVEVISGWSQKGKSALVQIVDYCLGSDKCAIPVGRVRDTVEWFGLVLALPDKRIVIARRNPGNNPSSSDMMWIEGRTTKLPENPERNAGRDSVIDRLNQLASLPSQGSLEDDTTSFDGPPSFRDMAAFNYQPQHIIANPYTLFFKADTSVHREKLVRSVFPYVLGAVDSVTLSEQSTLRRLEQDLRQKREQLEQYELASAMWKGRLQNYVAVMQQYGLLDPELVIDENWSVDVFVELLRPIPGKWKAAPHFNELDGLAKQARKQILALQAEESRLNREINDAERKVRKVAKLQSASDSYRDAIALQQERLSPSLWLAERIEKTPHCPMCGGQSTGDKQLAILADVARQIGGASVVSRSTDEALGTEIRRLEEMIATRKKDLTHVESRLKDWEQKTASLKDSRNRREAISNLVGQLNAVIETIDAASSSSKLRKEVEKLAKEVDLLARKVNFGAIRRRTDTALANISKLIGHYAGILQVEHSSHHWGLDDRNLTLSSKGANKTDFLWEIGSAANWMGYHVATLLALHEHFRGVAHNPVPKFLMIDQPSQAFFPEGLMSAKRSKGAKRFSDDLERLRRLFRALSDAVGRTKKGLQIILLEHAEPETWDGIPHFSMPDGQWRENNALIPLDWK